ncbi:MAG: sigma-70 family RNA polymerase sigma factor [Candidatus Melainabacteria bacterium]|nr:sigma-70 family RNA polymerase sigma factor [Candidatus Melainabacteria bacterium]
MPSQEDKIKSLKIDSNTAKKPKAVNEYLPIVEMIGRKEMGTKSKQIISYEELTNTGLIAVNKLIETAKLNPGTEYNSSYIAQSVKWAMKDEVRSRQSWYGVKKVVPVDQTSEEAKAKAKDPTETTEIKTADDARKAVFEVIMSVDSMAEDQGFAPADPNAEENLDRLALIEMKQALLKVIKKLPDNLRSVIEMRFYKNMSGNEVAEKLSVTPSRISHMIREAVKKLKVLMVAEGYTSL